MDCPIKTQEDTNWLLDYTAGRLRGERAAQFARHVETCGDCAGFVNAQQVLWNALDQWEPEAVSMDFDRRLYRRIEESRPSSGFPGMVRRLFHPLQPLWRPVVPLAAACLLVVAGVMLVLFGVPTRAAADAWRRRLDWGGGATVLFLVPGLCLVATAVAFTVLTENAALPAESAAGVAALALAILSGSLNAARGRQDAAGLAFRKRLVAARRYFAEQLQQPAPHLEDGWFPYLIALGLDNKMQAWFRSFPGISSGSSMTPVSSRTASGGSVSGGSWTGGGGSFGGAGASASWAAAASGMAAGVAAPSSGSGGGSSGGGSSGGGGGGGW